MIIAIHGKASSGKGTVADIIGKLLPPYSIISFADAVKNEVLNMFPQAQKECLFGPSEKRAEKLPESNLTHRDVLLRIGKLGRDVDPEFWIKKLNFSLSLYHFSCNIIIPDLRFKNEYQFCKESGHILWKIVRDDYTKIDDESETELDDYQDSAWDAIVDNNQGLEHLESQVKKLLKI